MPPGVGYGPGAMAQAFMGGGGGAAPSPFRAPAGIPDPRAMQAPPQAQAAAPPIDLYALLRSGAISAEQLLAMVAALAGMGQGPPQGPPGGGGGEMMQAFMGGGE